MKKGILFVLVAAYFAGSTADINNAKAKYCNLPDQMGGHYLCLNGTVQEPCADRVLQGTQAFITCDPGYYKPIPHGSRKMNCVDGLWDWVETCEVDCGTVTPKRTELKRSLHTAQAGEVPWRVAIYSKKANPYKYICGGSLVHTDTVISVASCFWAEQSQSSLPASDYAVAVGKMYRPWNSPNDADSQTSDVREISLPARFRGGVTNYQDDISIVKLNTPVQYKTHVRPICLNFDINFERHLLTPGNPGKVAVWQTSFDNSESAILKVLDLPYVDFDQCFTEIPPSFRQYITSDKICAYSKDPSEKVCRGASGEGVAFPASNNGITRFYLLGLMSVATVDDDDNQFCSQFVAHTEVLKHEHFIKSHV